MGQRTDCRLIAIGAGNRGAESTGTCKITATSIRRPERNRGPTGARTRSRVPDIEHVLVVRNLSRLPDGAQIRKRGGLECRAGIRDRLSHWNQHAQAFIVEEEESPVLLNRSAEGRCPLIGIDKGPWSSRRGVVVEPVVGVHRPAIPPVSCVAVELVAT